MRMFLHLFLSLLLPISILFVVLSIGYFTFNYDFSKAIKLGILMGVLIGIAVSLIATLGLLVLRMVQKDKVIVVSNEEEIEQEHSPKEIKGVTKEIKCMLLMDKELSFNVILNALRYEKNYRVSKSDPEKGILNIETEEGSIKTTITALTKHSSQVMIHAINNVKEVRNILSQMKEKEHTFLQY